jgi:NAD(P)H-hydrate epimerase
MIEVLSNENMRLSDNKTIENGKSGISLMYDAAIGIYNSTSWYGRVGIVCGNGNNAGDGYALAWILKQNGIDVSVIRLTERFSPDGKYYYDKCKENDVFELMYKEDTGFDYDIIVDCIFGTGFKGSADGVFRDAILKINNSGAYVISADINSGLNGDNGLCDVAVRSDLTVSVGSYKSGHFLGKAKDYIKKKTNVDIGITPIEKPYYLIEENDVKSVFSERLNFSNKGTYGYATLIGGCTEYSGAMKLANMAVSALRSGAGVVRLASAKSLSYAYLPYLLESTFYPLSDTDGSIMFNKEEIDGALKGARAVAIGMGIGQKCQAYEIIKYVLENYQMPVIIDADGLNALSSNVDALKNTKCKIVLTPHVAEFERLSKVSKNDILENPVYYSKKFASEYNVTLLLKGTSTIITDGENVVISDTGCAGMATAGSGDVLSGILLGIFSQNPNSSPLLNTASGAYINGRAGELAQKRNGAISMLSSDTASCIPDVLKNI